MAKENEWNEKRKVGIFKITIFFFKIKNLKVKFSLKLSFKSKYRTGFAL